MKRKRVVCLTLFFFLATFFSELAIKEWFLPIFINMIYRTGKGKTSQNQLIGQAIVQQSTVQVKKHSGFIGENETGIVKNKSLVDILKGIETRQIQVFRGNNVYMAENVALNRKSLLNNQFLNFGCAMAYEKSGQCRAARRGKLRTVLPNFYLNKTLRHQRGDVVYRNNSDIAFVHVPKVGGTSVEAFLGKNLIKINLSSNEGITEWKKYEVSHCSNFYQTACEAKTSFRAAEGGTVPVRNFFYSKRVFGLHKFLLSNEERPLIYITWFREPISRLVSSYYYLKKNKPDHHILCKIYLESSQTISDFLRSSRDIQYPLFDNLYVRLLQFGDYPLVDEYFEDYIGMDTSLIPAINKSHYMIAKRNLENMAFIGLLEEWKISIEMLSYMLQIPSPDDNIQVNVNPHRTQMTTFAIKELKRRNKWDMLLYEYAKKIFSKQKNVYFTELNLSTKK